jgi:hypothetical protein
MNNKTRIIVGISLPIIVVIVVVIAAVWPRLFFHPKYDFLYTVDSPCGSYYSDCSYPYRYGDGFFRWAPYKIVDGKLAKESIPNLTNVAIEQVAKDNFKFAYPPIYRYSVDTNTFKQLSFDEASQISLLEPGSAPDGTTIINGGYNENLIGAIFGGRSNGQGLYLKNGSFSKQIIVQNASQPYYSYNASFRILGWVK